MNYKKKVAPKPGENPEGYSEPPPGPKQGTPNPEDTQTHPTEQHAEEEFVRYQPKNPKVNEGYLMSQREEEQDPEESEDEEVEYVEEEGGVRAEGYPGWVVQPPAEIERMREETRENVKKNLSYMGKVLGLDKGRMNEIGQWFQSLTRENEGSVFLASGELSKLWEALDGEPVSMYFSIIRHLFSQMPEGNSLWDSTLRLLEEQSPEAVDVLKSDFVGVLVSDAHDMIDQYLDLYLVPAKAVSIEKKSGFQKLRSGSVSSAEAESIISNCLNLISVHESSLMESELDEKIGEHAHTHHLIQMAYLLLGDLEAINERSKNE